MSAIELPSPLALKGPDGLTRRELFIWVIVCLLANHALHTIDTQSVGAVLNSLASLNLIYWFAFYVIVRRLIDSHSEGHASWLDVAAAIAGSGAIVLVSFVGYPFAVGVLMTFAAAYLLFLHQGDLSLKAAGAVLLTVSVHLVWGPVFFRYFTPQLLAADAALVNALLSALDSKVALIGTTFYAPKDHALQLVGACSSFNNVSIAVLASAAVTMRVRPYWVRQDIVWILVVCGVMIALNAARLAVLALSEEYFLYWHAGPGVPVIALVQTAIIVLMSYLAAVSGVRSK